ITDGLDPSHDIGVKIKITEFHKKLLRSLVLRPGGRSRVRQLFAVYSYFFNSLLITTTSRTTTNTPITVQSHIPPPSQPFIHPLA
ncbi:MAG: hypothetical protein ACXW2V_09000, partial [Candidatus Aminicenantales bacterium]